MYLCSIIIQHEYELKFDKVEKKLHDHKSKPFIINETVGAHIIFEQALFKKITHGRNFT